MSAFDTPEWLGRSARGGGMVRGMSLDVDVAIIGGGPAGSSLACMLAQDGRRVVVLERDIHPRDHVGESLVPGNNAVLNRLGFLPKMEDAGFVHKQGVGWTAPRSRPWQF